MKTPDIAEQLRLHFIYFVEVDNHLYELDGRRSSPINHGRCSNFIEINKKMDRSRILQH